MSTPAQAGKMEPPYKPQVKSKKDMRTKYSPRCFPSLPQHVSLSIGASEDLIFSQDLANFSARKEDLPPQVPYKESWQM